MHGRVFLWRANLQNIKNKQPNALQPYRIKQENDNNGIGIQKLILDLTGRESINQINI